MNKFVDQLRNIKEDDQRNAETAAEIYLSEQQQAFGQQADRFVRLVKEEMVEGRDPELDFFNWNGEIFAGKTFVRTLGPRMFLFLTDDGHKLIEAGSQCEIDVVRETDDSNGINGQDVTVLKEPVSFTGETPDDMKWHERDVATVRLDPQQEVFVGMMAGELERKSNQIELARLR